MSYLPFATSGGEFEDGTKAAVLFSQPGYNNPPPLSNHYAHNAVICVLVGVFLPLVDVVGALLGIAGVFWARHNQQIDLSRSWAAVIVGTICALLKLTIFCLFRYLGI